MKIGLYFGTFNPIHIGHLIIANHIVENTDLDQIWFIVTPHNPFKNKKTLLDDYQRLHLVNIAIENYPKLKSSDIEFKLPQPNYTVFTLAYLKEKYATHDFSLIMGEDNIKSIYKWKNFEIILNNHEIYVYPRISSAIDSNIEFEMLRTHFIHAPIVEISSTFIRDNIKKNKNIRPLLPYNVWEYIDINNLYKK